MLKYNALYFTYPSGKTRFQPYLPSCFALYRRLSQVSSNSHTVRQFNQVSSTFEAVQCILSPILFAWTISQNSRHYKTSRVLCSINAISSPSCVFKLQNPIVLHCLISPLKNWDVWVFFYGVNNPIEIHSCNSFYEL